MLTITSARVVTAATALMVLLFLLLQLLGGKTSSIRLHDDQVEIQQFANSIAKFIIEQGYGHKVELVESTIKEVRARLMDGDIDLTLELWKENNLSWLKKGEMAGKLLDLGELYSNGKQFWIVSKWYADKHNIHSVFDMKNHWQDFADPGDPAKGIFFNCIYGWTCRDINRAKLSAYNLDRYFNAVSPLSPESLKRIYEKSSEKQLPVFGYYWEPNYIMDKQDWHILQEPPYNEETWLKVIESSLDPGKSKLSEACAYKPSGASKIATTRLSTRFPEITRMLAAMAIDQELAHSILAEHRSEPSTPQKFEQLGRWYLQTFPERWHPWVTDTARANIEAALLNQEKTRNNKG